MKSTLFVLLVLTTTSACLGQTTPSNDLPIPTTDCGKKALKCWSDQQVAMGQADDAFDFATGCSLYRDYINCYDTVVKNPTCEKEPEVESINIEIAQDRGGVCLTDGSVTICGSDLQSCMQDVLDIENQLSKKNATAICPVFNKFLQCDQMTQNRPECSISPKILDSLDKSENEMYIGYLLSGCEGLCASQVAQCLGNLTDKMVNADFMSLDWKQFCRDAYAALDCVFALNSTGNCSGNDLVKRTLDSQHRLFGTRCAGNGKPAPCIEELMKCQSTWRSSQVPQMTAKQQCQEASYYLDCTTKTSCTPDMNDVLIDLRQDIDMDETKYHCPTEGSCLDRLIICTFWQRNLNMTKTSNITRYCRVAMNGYDCFKYVRSDALCKTENITISPFEVSLPTLLQTKCAAFLGGSGQTSVHVFLIVTAFLLSAIGLL